MKTVVIAALTTLQLLYVGALHPLIAGETIPVRPQPNWPPQRYPVRVVIDTDAANEIDDQYALAVALAFPEKLNILGLVAAHFGEGGGAAGIERSIAEIHTVLDEAGLKGAVPVKSGVNPFDPNGIVPTSDGIDLIVRHALRSTPQDPLWLITLGPPTDAVAALLKEPRIADRMVVFWHGRSDWPAACRNFNARNDPAATRVLFDLPSRFILFDTGAHLTLPLNTSRRIASSGPLGLYLHEIRSRNPHWLSDKKGIYDLGDIAALVDPTCARWEVTQAPSVTEDLSYNFALTSGQIVRIYDVDRAAALRLLDEALRRLQHRKQQEPDRFQK